MTRDFANQLDRTMAALESFFREFPDGRRLNAERGEAIRQIAYLRGLIEFEPCTGDPSLTDLIRRWWRK